MSAFEVSGTHIDAMVSAALQRRRGSMLRWYWTDAQGDQSREIGSENAEQVGAMLLAENRRQRELPLLRRRDRGALRP